MNMFDSTSNIFLNGWREYRKKIVSIRFFSVVVLMAALVCAIATGIDRFMIDKQEWITPWMAPHFFNNKFFVTFYGFIVCYMYSDVPFMNRSELYYVLRKGRRVWCAEKIFAIIMEAFTLTLITYIASVVVFIPMLQLQTDWGKVIHTLAYSNNLWEYNIIGNPSAVIIAKYSPLQAMSICFVMVWLVSSVIGILMFGISLYWNRVAAISAAVIVTGLNMSEGNYITSAWLPYLTPFNWCRIGLHGETIFLDSYYPSLYVCLGLCCALLICGIIAIMKKAGHIEFVWNKEE